MKGFLASKTILHIISYLFIPLLSLKNRVPFRKNTKRYDLMNDEVDKLSLSAPYCESLKIIEEQISNKFFFPGKVLTALTEMNMLFCGKVIKEEVIFRTLSVHY